MKPVAIIGIGGLAAALAAVLIAGSHKLPSAPDVRYTSIQGEQTTQAALKGKVVLVNFWATSCSGCMAEMPKLIATQQKYAAQGLKTVAVAMEYDEPSYVATFTQAHKLPFFVALDADGQLAKQFGEVSLTPTTFLIDKQGHIVQRFTGEPDFKALDQLIEDKLAET